MKQYFFSGNDKDVVATPVKNLGFCKIAFTALKRFCELYFHLRLPALRL